jgi:ubiquinone/menaquinone biosynthesis C-methylase UbiE
MNNLNGVGIGYDYVMENYMSDRQLDCYTKRVFEKGLSETEEVLINYYFEVTDTVLDIGTGCGRFAVNAYEKGFTDMCGIDMNPKFIGRAAQICESKKYDIDFSVQNSQYTTFKDRTFESAIFTSDGFSQIPGNENKLAVLKEIYRIMKPMGILILSVIDEELVRENSPDYAEIIDAFRKSEDWKTKNFYDENDVFIYDGGYMHFASVEETTNLIAKSGFKLLFSATPKYILGNKDKKSSNISRFFILMKS